MRTRTITAIVFGAILLGALFINIYTYTGLFIVLNALTALEYAGLLEEPEMSPGAKMIRKIAMVAISMIPMLVTILFFAGHLNYIVYCLPLLFLTVPIVLTMELFLAGNKPYAFAGQAIMSALYIGIPYTIAAYCGLFVLKATGIFSPFTVLSVFLLVWANDIFAYIVGSKIGKTRMFPRISPNKTWEGTLSGTFFCMLTALILWKLSTAFSIPVLKDLDILGWALYGAICSAGGIFGDLVESMFKRSIGVKDSGTLLPGHGGFLDRFDAFLFAMPMAYVFLLYYIS